MRGKFAIAFSSAVLILVSASAETVRPVRLPSDIVVTDFGAKGDGLADDTAALQKAADALWKVNGDGILPYNRGASEATIDGIQARMVFPAGTYRLTAPVFFRKKVFAVAEGRVDIVQTDEASDAFYCCEAFICRFEGLSFRGGRSQIRLATHNTEGANLRIKDCSFADSAASAVECLSFKTEPPLLDAHGKIVGIGEWMWDANVGRHVRDPRWDGPRSEYNNSTFLLIEGCRFEACGRAATFACDGAMMRNCKIVSRRNVSGGSIRVANTLHASGIDATLLRAPALEQSLFEGSGKIWIEESRIHTDDGSGAPVVIYSNKVAYVASYVVLSHVETCGPPESGLLAIRGGAPPNIAAFLNVRNTGSVSAPAMAFRTPATEVSLRLGPVWKMVPVDGAYAFAMRGCTGVDVPSDPLTRKFWRSCPTDAGRNLFHAVPRPVRVGPVFSATEDGVDCDPATDDTAAMRRFMARLAATPGSTGLLPAAILTVRETLVLDGDFTLAGAGLAVVRGLGDDTDIFRAAPKSNVALANLQMRGGHRVLVVEPDAQAWMDNCFIYRPCGAAISTSRGAEVHVDGGMVYSARLYEGEGRASINETWYRFLSPTGRNEPFRPMAAIVNRGELQIMDLLGVPTVFSRYPKRSMRDPSRKPVAFRWVDNYGAYLSRGMRYGGEWGGLTPVYHYGGAHTRIEGGHMAYTTTSTYTTPLLADSPEPDAALFAVSLPAYCNIYRKLAMQWRPALDAEPVPVRKERIDVCCPSVNGPSDPVQ